jgi:hypothetical protein
VWSIEWSVSCPDRFTLEEKAPDNLWMGGWVGLNAGLDVVKKTKNPSPLGKWEMLPAQFCTAYTHYSTVREVAAMARRSQW